MQPPATPAADKAFEIRFDVGTMAHWFLPLVGVAYSAGFLIVFTFSKSFGIEGAELLQGKYIHVGSLFVMACVVIALPILWLFHLVSAIKLRRQPLASVLGLALYGMMLFTFYVIVAFTERGFFHNNGFLVLANFILPLLYSLIRLSLPLFIKDSASVTVQWLIGIFCSVLQGYLMYRTLAADGLWGHLVNVFPLSPPSGVYGFIALVVSAVLYACLAMVRWRELPDTRSRLTILISTLSLLGVLFYFAILTFAFAIYPHIPSGKGGGYFADSTPVQLSFRDTPLVDTDIRASMATTDSPFIILYEGSESIFLASIRDAEGPAHWATASAPKPTVYEIRRDTLTGVHYLNPSH